MLALLYTVHVLICIFLIMVVLLQQGKGADLSVFGGGGTMTAFGARGAATVLHKMTVVSFVLFIITTLAIGVVLGTNDQGSVMTDIDAPAAAAATEEAESAAEPVGVLEGDEATPEDAAASAEDAAAGAAPTGTDGEAASEEPAAVDPEAGETEG